MTPAITSIAYQNANSGRKFPLYDSASVVADNGTRLPDALLSDLSLWFPHTHGSYAYLLCARLVRGVVSLVFGVSQTPHLPGVPGSVAPLMVVTQRFTGPGTVLQLTGLAPGCGGQVTLGTDIAQLPDGDWVFSCPGNAPVLPRCAWRYHAGWIPAITRPGLTSRLTGDVRFDSGNEQQLSIAADLEDPQRVRIGLNEAVSGLGVYEQFRGPCSGSPLAGTCTYSPIFAINGVVPRADGSITLKIVDRSWTASSSTPPGLRVYNSPPISPPETSGLPGTPSGLYLHTELGITYLRWTAAENCAWYTVERFQTDHWEVYDSAYDGENRVPYLPEMATDCFRVRGYSSFGSPGNYSDTFCSLGSPPEPSGSGTLPMLVPTGFHEITVNGEIHVVWAAVPGAYGYQLSCSLVGDPDVFIDTDFVLLNSSLAAGAFGGAVAKIRVRSIRVRVPVAPEDSSDWSLPYVLPEVLPPSEGSSSGACVDIPQNVRVQYQGLLPFLLWSPVAGASGYRIDGRRASTGLWEELGTTTGTTLQMYDFSAYYYSFRVCGYLANGVTITCYGDYSGEIFLIPVPGSSSSASSGSGGSGASEASESSSGTSLGAGETLFIDLGVSLDSLCGERQYTFQRTRSTPCDDDCAEWTNAIEDTQTIALCSWAWAPASEIGYPEVLVSYAGVAQPFYVSDILVADISRYRDDDMFEFRGEWGAVLGFMVGGTPTYTLRYGVPDMDGRQTISNYVADDAIWYLENTTGFVTRTRQLNGRIYTPPSSVKPLSHFTIPAGTLDTRSLSSYCPPARLFSRGQQIALSWFKANGFVTGNALRLQFILYPCNTAAVAVSLTAKTYSPAEVNLANCTGGEIVHNVSAPPNIAVVDGTPTGERFHTIQARVIPILTGQGG